MRTILLISLMFILPASAANLLKGGKKLKHSLGEVIPEAIDSYYSPRVALPLKNWPPKYLPKTWEGPVWMRAIRHPEDSLYIGLIKRVRIDAPLERVEHVMDDFETYDQMFDDVKSTERVSKDGNKFVIRWERDAPVFFVPNIRYDQCYLVDKRSRNRIIYRYQVIVSNSVNSSDGVIVLEREGDKTLLTAWDFFSANWGILGSLAEGSIWMESLRGSYKGDLAFKLRNENPTWDRKQILEEVDNTVDKHPYTKIEFLEEDLFAEMPSAKGINRSLGAIGK